MKKLVLTMFFGSVMVTPYCQNVGIDTTSPVAKLDVSSSDNYTARFNGSNQMYFGLSENQVLKGYMGSFSGLADDVDMGTSSGNTSGKLHLTIKAIPKLTIDNAGNVGIGTTTPSEKLDVPGNIMLTGEVKPNGIAGAAGQVLTSNGNGTMQWAALSSSGNSNSSGNGGWGDCSIYNIDSYLPVANRDSKNGDVFGKAVAISGNYALVGAWGDDENGFSETGSATFYKFNSSTSSWENQGKIFNQSFGNFDKFGYAVAISGDYAIIGALTDTELGITECGSATIFKLNPVSNIWESQGKILNLNPASDDWFGHSVAISGNYAAVGAPLDTEAGLTRTGSVCIFKRNSSTGVWENQGKITNPNPGAFDQFGYSVSMTGDYLIVGANNDIENGLESTGSATIFKRNTNTGIWESQGKLLNQNPLAFDQFGQSVAICEDYAAIGAPGDDFITTDNDGTVSVFQRNLISGLWEFSKTINNPKAEIQDGFGSSVSISNQYLLAGSFPDDEGGILNSGSVSIFRRSENFWLLHQKFCYPNPDPYSGFGGSLNLDPLTQKFLIGAAGFAQGNGLAMFGKIK